MTDNKNNIIYTSEFINWFGDWESLSKAKFLGDNITGFYKTIFKGNEEQFLFEMAVQANSNEISKNGAIKIAGEELINLALKLYPNAKIGDKFYPTVSKVVDEKGEPTIYDIINFLYVEKKYNGVEISNYLIIDINKGQFEKSVFIHSAEKTNRNSILENGLHATKNPVILKGIFTFPEQWGHHKDAFDKKEFDFYKITLKDGSKLFWTDSDRPMDAIFGNGNDEYNKVYDKLVQNTSAKNREGVMKFISGFQGGDNKKWFDWKSEFSREMEKYLAENNYAGIQEGGQVVITDLNSIESITLNGKKVKVNNELESGGSLPSSLSVNQMGFYSPIEKRIIEFKSDRASANKWKDIVGTKSDESIFTGLTDYLNSKKPDEQILKIEILNFIRDNSLELIEVVKNDNQNYLSETHIKQRENGMYALAYNDTNEFVNDEDEFDSPAELKDYYDQEEWTSGSDVPYKTKYSKHVLSGKSENYTEVLIMLPDEAKKNRLFYNKLFNALSDTVKQRFGIVPNSVKWNTFNLYDYKYKLSNEESLTNNELQQLNYIDSLADKSIPIFTSSHWDEKNILVHLRYDIRNDVDGNKFLFVIEIQSDYGQKGKREGFKKPLTDARKQDISDRLLQLQKIEIPNAKTGQELQKLHIEHDALNKEYMEFGLPNAPFVTDTNKWVKLGLKVLLQHAVKLGVNKLSWMTGEQENALYDLSKQLNKISWWQVGDDENGYGITAYDKSNQIVLKERDIDLKQIEKLVGKDVAEKIKNKIGLTNTMGQTTYGELTGDDLKLTGSGMIGFYGSVNKNEIGIIGSVLKSLVKELIGKPTEINKIEIKKSDLTFRKSKNDESGEAVTVNYKGEVVDNYGDYEQGKKHFESYMGSSIQYAIDITPELQASIENGIPMFKKGGVLNPYSICTVSIGHTAGTQKRSKWNPAQLKKYENCVLKVKNKMAIGGGLFVVLHKISDNKYVVYSDNEGYSITVNNPDDAKYIELWYKGERVGVLEARENYLNDYHGHTGKFLSIESIYIDREHQGKRFGLKLYQVLHEFSSNDIIGFFSDLEKRQNKKVIPRIYSHFNNEIVGDYHIVTFLDGGIVEQTICLAIYRIEEDEEHWYMVAKYNVSNDDEVETIKNLVDKSNDEGYKVKAITKKQYEEWNLGDEIQITDSDEYFKFIEKNKENGNEWGAEFNNGGLLSRKKTCNCKFRDNKVPSKNIHDELLHIK